MTKTTPEPPERIYGWLETQLSIARHYGGCSYEGFDYVIDAIRPDPPLVRVDVLARENKAKALEARARRLAIKQQAKAQGNLI